MKLSYIDELYITRPMSEEERISLLKSFQEESFLSGIDKGTILERDTLFRLNQIKEQNFEKKYKIFIEKLSDHVHLGVKRNNRRKYYNSSNGPSGEKKEKIDLKVDISNLPPWLK